MQKYNVPSLNMQTSQAARTKLITALKGVKGVESAKLHPETSEFEVHARDKQMPKRDAISAAASKAGFALAPKA